MQEGDADLDDGEEGDRTSERIGRNQQTNKSFTRYFIIRFRINIYSAIEKQCTKRKSEGEEKMDGKDKNDHHDDHLELNLSMHMKNNSQKPSLLFPFNFPSKQIIPSSNGIVFHSLSGISPKNISAIDLNEPVLPLPPLPALLSPSSNLTSTDRKRTEREEDMMENNIVGIDGTAAGDSSSKKKLKLSREQVEALEETFKDQPIPSQNEKSEMARKLNLQARQVEVWFQNRRARMKTNKTVINYENMKIQYANLVEENNRLKKEVADLKAVTYMQMQPLTTLDVCLQCKLANVPPKSSTTTSPTPPAEVGSSWFINRLKETYKEQN